VPEEKISVTYLGSDLHLLPEVEGVSGTEKEFILYVGKRRGYKNFSNFAIAFSHSKMLMTNFQIIAVGGGDFSSDELSEFQKLGIADKVIHMDANDYELAMLYRKAACLVYPSIFSVFAAMRCKSSFSDAKSPWITIYTTSPF
jgi:glycosyltransferase involved in cell wall biosynthesis